MERYVRRYPIKGKEDGFLEIDTYYDKGELSGKRGYWMSWQPLKRTEDNESVTITFSPYSGTKYFVIPLKRNGKKAYEKAKQMLIDSADGLIQLSGCEVENTFEEREY